MRAGFGQQQPLLPRFGVGKWSRIATVGHKEQEQPNGERAQWEFTLGRFRQAVRNFARRFAQRRMGADYEHQTLHAPQNGQPAPQLCFWDGMAVIDGDKVDDIHEQRPGPAPDPQELRGLLQERFPESDPSPTGLWVRCGEITPMGEKLIPNYDNLSPLFNEAQEDEAGEQIGFSVSNIAFVSVGHQDGTFFNFGAFNFADDALHPAGPERREKKRMNDQEMMKKLGLAEDADTKAMGAAFANYMAETSDGPEERKAMKGFMDRKMAAPFEGKETPEEEKKAHAMRVQDFGNGNLLVDPGDKILNKKTGKIETVARQDLNRVVFTEEGNNLHPGEYAAPGGAMAARSLSQAAFAAVLQEYQANKEKLDRLTQIVASQEQEARAGRVAAFCATQVQEGNIPAAMESLLRKSVEAEMDEKQWPKLLGDIPKGAFKSGGAFSSSGNAAPKRIFIAGVGAAAAPSGGAFGGQRRDYSAFSAAPRGYDATQRAYALLEQRGVKDPSAHQLSDALVEISNGDPQSLRAD